MAHITCYYDISLNGGGAGTPSNPYTWDDAIAIYTQTGFINSYDIDFFVRGTRIITTSFQMGIGSGVDAHWHPWDLATYGPWRIGIDSSVGTLMVGGEQTRGYFWGGAVFKAPTVQFGDESFWSYHVNNVAVIANNINFNQSPYGASDLLSSVFKGCSFIADQTVNIIPLGKHFSSDNVYGTVFQDCAFKFSDSIAQKDPYYYPFAPIKFYNCALPKTVQGHDYTALRIDYYNCQIDWTPATFPAWDSTVKSDWNNTSLLTGLTYPPQPGNPPYSDYTTGLWGEPRIGIGAVYFDATTTVPDTTHLSYFLQSSMPDWTNVTSVVNLPAVIQAIQDSSSDTYFDSTDEIDKVYIYYHHTDGRQFKRIIHEQPDMSTSISWSQYAVDGTWVKDKIRVFDTDGAEHTIFGDVIGSDENIKHDRNNIFLNPF